jgi:ABC-type ATPase with predicted acetyltransferase domain
MNSNIAKQRLSEVVRIDTITSSQGDFLATHVPVKKLQLLKKYDSNTTSSSDKTYSEEEIYRNVVLNPKNKHQFILVIGSSGAGKSHLIRWFDAKLERTHPDDEVVLFVRRSDNSLKGTIKQLLEKEEIAQIPNKEVYERLIRATSNIDEKKDEQVVQLLLRFNTGGGNSTLDNESHTLQINWLFVILLPPIDRTSMQKFQSTSRFFPPSS